MACQDNKGKVEESYGVQRNLCPVFLKAAESIVRELNCDGNATVLKDGSMFSNLKKYQDEAFRREQGKVFIYLPDKVLECEIVECRQVSVKDSVYEIIQDEEKELPKEIILSTCSSSSNTRLILRTSIMKIR